MPVRIGLIGKTNVGKTTLFDSMTLLEGEISNYPFTTKTPETGVGNVSTLCVHGEFGVKDNPINSRCEDGWRFIPIELTDLPGLIKGAAGGRGLGNQFLSVAAQSDALLHVVDASGSVDNDGRISDPGTGDPVADFAAIEIEIALWYTKLFLSNLDKISKLVRLPGYEFSSAVAEVFQGIGVRKEHVTLAMKNALLNGKEFSAWTDDEVRGFCSTLREVSKPTIIVANKIDLPFAARNFRRITDEYKGRITVPTSAEAELILRKADSKGLIKYVPGEERFELVNQDLSEGQKSALARIRRDVFGEYLRTGVQHALNVAVFKLLRMNTIYPVADPRRLADKNGRVLPDAYLLPDGSTIRDLALSIHTDLARGLLYAVDARTGFHLPTDYILRDRDVVSPVSTAAGGGW